VTEQTATLSTTYPDRESWLAARQLGIGASDVPVILGMVKWKSPYELWAEKTGRLIPEPAGIAAELGHFLEPWMAERYESVTEDRIEDTGDFTIFTHRKYPWLSCTPDRLIVVSREEANPLELKTTGAFSRSEWSEGPPLRVQAQLQAQMAVLGSKRGAIAALIGNREFVHFEIERSDPFIELMIERCAKFWQEVQEDTLPEVTEDSHTDTLGALQRIHTDDNGETVHLSEEAYAACLKREEVNAALSDGHKKKAALDAIIRASIGDATFGEHDGLLMSLKTSERKGYAVKASKSRTLRRVKN
jgi:putative phage-type endonuclease